MYVIWRVLCYSGDSFSGKTTILQIAASLIGSDRVSLQTFYVGNSTIKTIADLQVQILRKAISFDQKFLEQEIYTQHNLLMANLISYISQALLTQIYWSS